jgi:elongation factor Ts
MTITAADVNKLPPDTGAGNDGLQAALTRSQRRFRCRHRHPAQEGPEGAAKRSDREAREGLVIAKTSDDNTRGVMICLNCETDFVAKNADFGALADRIATIALEKGAGSIDALKAMPYDTNGLSIAEKVVEQTGVIGEKLDISVCDEVKAPFVYAYNHPGNKVASLIGLSKAGHPDAAKDVAMQVAAMAPIALDKASVPQSVIDKEVEIGKELAIQEGKPADMAEKIAMGRLNKFFKENTLVAQEFIKDNKVTVEQYLKSIDKDLVATGFKRHSLMQ